jgi:hypothetical protein
LSDEFRILIVLSAMLTVPGWALLSWTGVWRDWTRAQRWFLAIGTSVAVYPAAFYLLRLLLPGLNLGPGLLAGFLLAATALTCWKLRGHWRDQVAFDRWDWVTISILGLTLFTRIWIVRDLPYPAWSDSLHHAILTHLTAISGRLPFTMDPYFPIPLGQYHLGLYALSGTAEALARVPAQTALVYTAQVLNGLCVIGVFLVLDRMCGRLGAIAGAVVVGLISSQPAFYVNYGRFTQLAAQTVLFPAWLLTRQALRGWRIRVRGSGVSSPLAYSVLAGLLNASVFLLHFRVAALYLPLLLILVFREGHQSYRQQQVRAYLLGLAAVGLLSLCLVSPALGKALQVYVQNPTAQPALTSMAATSQLSEARQAYFHFPLQLWSRFAAPIWLLALALISAVFAAVRRNGLAMATLAWAGAMILIGEAYLLRLPLLEVTNLGTVSLLLYLPISLALGTGLEEFLRSIRSVWRERAAFAAMFVLAAAAIVGSHTQVMRIESYRHFVTDGDLAAMTWIRDNTPQDALFAVNTYFWVPLAPMGTDGGYWIPYCTGRATTASCSIFDLGSKAYANRIVRLSTAAKRLAKTNEALEDLRALGVRYVYIGVKGSFDGPGFVPQAISQAPEVETVYQQRGVTILRLR